MQSTPPRAVTAICHALQEQIEHGLLAPGGKLPAERRLSEVFDTTRITLREALVQLEAQGLIYREERRGWFVAPQRLTYDLIERSHFHAMVRDQGRVASTELLSARLQPASAAICARLQLPALSVWCASAGYGGLTGGRCCMPSITSTPVLSRHSRTRPGAVTDRDLWAGVWHRVRAGVLRDPADSVAGGGGKRLESVGGQPGLHITRVNSDQHGHLIDCDLEYWRHDAIRIRAQAG